MKLTWFAATCFRLYVGGRIIVTDPDAAPAEFAPREIIAGADSVVILGATGLAPFAADRWSRRRPRSLIEADRETPLTLYRFGATGLFVDPPGEAPLILSPQGADWGRFADDAVVVLFGTDAALEEAIAALSAVARPKLIALASDRLDDAGFDALARAAAGTPLQVMEKALALEA